jgi:hypothetical protein
MYPQFLTSRTSTPLPFRPIRLDALTEADLEALEKLNGSPLQSNTLAVDSAKIAYGIKQQKVDLELLESQVGNMNGR